MPMRELAIALLSALALCGFGQAPPYDMSATPEATAIRQHALNRCRNLPTPTMRSQIDCSLAAHRAYAVATKLRDMTLFRTYATALRQAADDSDGQRISPYEAQSRIVRAGVKFRSTVETNYQDWRRNTGGAGVKPLYSRAAYSAALKGRTEAVARCGAWTDRATIPVRTACIHKAERAFVAVIQLNDMDLYYGYDSVLAFAAADAQDGLTSPDRLTARHQQIWKDFLRTLDQEYARHQAHKG